jgi:hypothetical protein
MGLNMKNELKLGDLGVCLSDYDESGDIYRIDDFLSNGDLMITSIRYASKSKIISQSDFWALI